MGQKSSLCGKTTTRDWATPWSTHTYTLQKAFKIYKWIVHNDGIYIMCVCVCVCVCFGWLMVLLVGFLREKSIFLGEKKGQALLNI
jgi:hypothetical protein